MNDPNNVVDGDYKSTNGAAPPRSKAIVGTFAMSAADPSPVPPTKSFYLLIVLAILWAVAGSAILYCFVEARWNTAPGTGSAASTTTSDADGLALVGILGAIGGYVRCLHTFTRCFSRDESLAAWAVSTFLTPLKSCLLALIVALVIKAGLVNASTPGNSSNWLGIYATAALVGLFANEAVSKLEEIFKTVFGAAQKSQTQGSTTQPPAN